MREVSKPYGVVAEFSTPEAVLKAAKAAKSAGFTKMDAYTPFPVHGLDEELEFKDYRVRWIMLFGGIFGACFGFFMQAWTAAVDYPVNVGGKPLLSLPSFVPVTFESTVLISALSGAIGMIVLNGLPKPYHPVFSAKNFDRASQDRFFLAIEAADPAFDGPKVLDFMNGLGAEGVEVIEGERE